MPIYLPAGGMLADLATEIARFGVYEPTAEALVHGAKPMLTDFLQ